MAASTVCHMLSLHSLWAADENVLDLSGLGTDIVRRAVMPADGIDLSSCWIIEDEWMQIKVGGKAGGL
jgi:hypothetical protein